MDVKKKSGCLQHGGIKVLSLPNGITLYIVNGLLKKKYAFQLYSDPDQIEFCFYKQAHLEFTYLDKTPDLSAIPMQTHLVINKEKEGKGIYFTDTPCQWITICFSIQALGSFFCLGRRSLSSHFIQFLKSKKFFCHNSTMTFQMYEAFKELFFCPFDQAEYILYAQAKCMELIALKLMQIQKPFLPPFRKDTTREEVIAGKTASMLLENMVSPPSLQELADHVGVSSSRLKQIFPKIYGTTPFSFLRRHRLEHARDLMIHSGFSASEAALHVGYSELSSFHRAFVREYGISPGQFRSRTF